MNHTPGVYQILNVINGKRYIGSSIDVKYRCTIHIARLRGGSHPNKYLQNAWKKYGEPSFLFEQVESAQDNLAAEQAWIDLCQPEYNLSSSATGVVHTEETCRKISEGRTKWLADGGAARLSEKTTNLHRDPEFAARWRAGVDSPEARAKISAGVRAKSDDPVWLAKRNASIKASWDRRKAAAAKLANRIAGVV